MLSWIFKNLIVLPAIVAVATLGALVVAVVTDNVNEGVLDSYISGVIFITLLLAPGAVVYLVVTHSRRIGPVLALLLCPLVDLAVFSAPSVIGDFFRSGALFYTAFVPIVFGIIVSRRVQTRMAGNRDELAQPSAGAL